MRNEINYCDSSSVVRDILGSTSYFKPKEPKPNATLLLLMYKSIINVLIGPSENAWLG